MAHPLTGSDNYSWVKAINPDTICHNDKIQIEDSTKRSATLELPKADSGIEIDLINEVKSELYQRMNTMIEEKFSEIATRKKDSRPMEHRSSSSSSKTRIFHCTDTGRTRDQNIIIHGIYEGDRDDGQYLTKLLEILGMGHTNPLTAHRLGMKKCDRQRPLKVTMKKVEEKQELMSRLGLLSVAEYDFRNISVTDDYTIAEREEIRRWVMMAKEKSKNETYDYVWKARGTPKTGMRLIRVKQY